MIEIIPAIIAKSFDELKEKIKLVEPHVQSVQIDIMDGIFVPEKTWPHNNCHPEFVSGSMEMLKQVENEFSASKQYDGGLDIEIHLIVEDAGGEIERWLDSGVKRILAHYEALKGDLRFTIHDLREKLAKKEIEFGVVLNLETPIDVLKKFLNYKSSFVIQLMSIAKIGEYGQPFDGRVIPKIRALREMFPDVKISVDGGINIENVKQVAEAGADILVVGSAIFNNKDIGGAIEELKNRIKN